MVGLHDERPDGSDILQSADKQMTGPPAGADGNIDQQEWMLNGFSAGILVYAFNYT